MPDNNFDELRQALGVDITPLPWTGAHVWLDYAPNKALLLLAVDSAPALLAALDQARAERDALRQRLMEAKENLETSNVELHAALYCLELNGIATDEVCERLAARDARMKREGAAEWLEARARACRNDCAANEYMAEASKLRKGGE